MRRKDQFVNASGSTPTRRMMETPRHQAGIAQVTSDEEGDRGDESMARYVYGLQHRLCDRVGRNFGCCRGYSAWPPLHLCIGLRWVADRVDLRNDRQIGLSATQTEAVGDVAAAPTGRPRESARLVAEYECPLTEAQRSRSSAGIWRAADGRVQMDQLRWQYSSKLAVVAPGAGGTRYLRNTSP